MKGLEAVYVKPNALATIVILALEYILLWLLDASYSWYVGILLHHIAMVVFMANLSSPNTNNLCGVGSLSAGIIGIITVGVGVWHIPDPFVRFGLPIAAGMLSVTVYLYCIAFIGIIILGDKFSSLTNQTS